MRNTLERYHLIDYTNRNGVISPLRATSNELVRTDGVLMLTLLVETTKVKFQRTHYFSLLYLRNLVGHCELLHLIHYKHLTYVFEWRTLVHLLFFRRFNLGQHGSPISLAAANDLMRNADSK